MLTETMRIQLLRPIQNILLIIVLLWLPGCTTVPRSNDVDKNNALQFLSEPNVSTIYILRTTKDYSAVELYIDIDEDTYRTFGNSFMRITLAPGPHEIKTDIPDILGSDQTLMLSTEAGSLYFIEYEPIQRFMLPDKALLHLLPNEQGKNAIISGKSIIFVESLKTN